MIRVVRARARSVPRNRLLGDVRRRGDRSRRSEPTLYTGPGPSASRDHLTLLTSHRGNQSTPYKVSVFTSVHTPPRSGDRSTFRSKRKRKGGSESTGGTRDWTPVTARILSESRPFPHTLPKRQSLGPQVPQGPLTTGVGLPRSTSRRLSVGRNHYPTERL